MATMTAAQVLSALAAGREVGGINGAIFSAQMRNVFAQGAHALDLVKQISELTRTGGTPVVEGHSAAARNAVQQNPAPQGASGHPPVIPVVVKPVGGQAPAAKVPQPELSAPASSVKDKPSPAKAANRPSSGSGSRWTAEEDTRLLTAFKAQEPVEAIAQRHQRTPVAIAIRLQQTHGLLSAEQVEEIRHKFRATSQASYGKRSDAEQRLTDVANPATTSTMMPDLQMGMIEGEAPPPELLDRHAAWMDAFEHESREDLPVLTDVVRQAA